MTAQLYLQKAEMQLSRGLEKKPWKACWQLLPARMGTPSAKPQARCLLGEYWFVHQQYAQALKQLDWISGRAEKLEHGYDDLLNEEIREAEVLLGIMQRFGLSAEQ